MNYANRYVRPDSWVFVVLAMAAIAALTTSFYQIGLVCESGTTPSYAEANAPVSPTKVAHITTYPLGTWAVPSKTHAP